jgi:hypothetical protein
LPVSAQLVEDFASQDAQFIVDKLKEVLAK